MPLADPTGEMHRSDDPEKKSFEISRTPCQTKFEQVVQLTDKAIDLQSSSLLHSASRLTAGVASLYVTVLRRALQKQPLVLTNQADANRSSRPEFSAAAAVRRATRGVVFLRGA